MSKCKDCNGTRVNRAKQEKYEKTIDFKIQGGTTRCGACDGNGLESHYPNSNNKGE